MSFRCQIFQRRLTFNNVFAKNCDVRLIILCLIANTAILPIIECAKLENPQIRLLINDDDLLQEKSNIHEAGTAVHENSGEHFNLYRSELKRLSYETIHRILRDENEPSYRREDTELRYYQKRSPTYEETHQLIKRATTDEHDDNILSFSKRNLTEFLLTSDMEKALSSVSLLDLSDNYLTVLNQSLIDKLSHLNTLNLRNNSFTSIPLSQQSTLKSINLNNNLIKTSILPSNIYLRNLYLSANHIEILSDIKLSLLKNLESLDISLNLLKNTESSFFSERMHNLKHLNLAHNQLGSIYRETFYNLLSLNTLLLSHNNITDIDYETFLALPNLQYLDLSFNRLRGKSIRALQGITGLVALNIAFNSEIGPYMQEFVASWSLKELDASGTGLCQIPAALAQSVRSLKLTHNWLKVINCGDLDSYPLLQYLDLSYSHIEQIEDDAMGRLEILEILMLDHNQLKKIPYSLPVSLEHLFLQNNDIMEIPQQVFQGLNNLKTLDLSHNKLMYLPDLALPKLLTLNLQSAEIKGINQGIVHTLPKLTDLMLEDNPIKCSDLLGIAEWASTCRLTVAKEEEEQGMEENVEGAEPQEGTEVENKEESLEFGGKITDLRKKFEKMHNFYEKFGFENYDETQSLLNSITKPSCIRDNLKTKETTASPTVNKDKNVEMEVAGKSLSLSTSFLLQKEPLLVEETHQDSTKTNKVEKFNQNSVISIPVLLASTAVKTLMEYNKTDADVKNAVKQQEDAVKTITLQNYAKPTTAVDRQPATMQPSIINEEQTFNTTTKTFNNALAATTPSTTTATTIQPTYVKPQEQQKQQQQQEKQHDETQPRFTNEMKTFDHLTTTAAATSITTSATKDEIASIGNTQTQQSFQNMTEVVKVATKRGKNVNLKITSKSLQNPKLLEMVREDMKEHKEKQKNLSKEAKDMTAALQEQELTTFATTAINSNEQLDTTMTTTMGVETFAQQPQQQKHEIITLKPQMNLLKDKQQQQHEIKTKIATAKEIKSLTTRTTTNPTTMQTTTLTEEPTIATTKMEIITLKSPTDNTANLDKSNKELKEFPTTNNQPHPSNNSNNITKPAHINKTPRSTITPTGASTSFTTNKDMTSTTTTSSTTAAILKTSTIESAAVAAVKDKDLASNYNDNDNNRLTTKTAITTSTTNTTTTTIFTNTNKTNSSNITTSNKNNKMFVTLDITTTTTPFTNIVHQNDNIVIVDQQRQQQQQHLKHHSKEENVKFYQSLTKDVNVKCMQSNSNDCNSSRPQRQEEIGRTPTVELTTTTTEPATTTTLPVIHKHEPLQLFVKDRHLIGTPLLMHKGENLMVTADELILPTTNHHDDDPEEDNKQQQSDTEHDTETATATEYAKNYKHILDKSQQHTIDVPKINISQDKKDKQTNNYNNKQQQQQLLLQQQAEYNKFQKSNLQFKTKKPSLIMKKMTIITKQHEEPQQQHGHQQQQEQQQSKENEVHQRNFDNTHYQELKPIKNKDTHTPDTPHNPKHSAVNTPINKEVNLLREPHTFQHEHELLIQQILQDQQAETHEHFSKTEQWSELRKAEMKENHPGLILLVSSGLFVVLLLGLMHVYRCDMPWKRHSPIHQLRPHQRQTSALEDDSHSFLSYNEGMQKWHHSTRLEAPYNSPLHSLHVRELQKTSGTEKPSTVKSSATNFKQSLPRSTLLANTRSLSQSSTSSTSTASPSSSAILDEESFYIEMTPDSGQFSQALQSELLPMELLNMAKSSQEYKETTADSQTSIEDECMANHQQHLTAFTASTPSAVPTSSSISLTSFNVKPQANPRKFGLW